MLETLIEDEKVVVIVGRQEFCLEVDDAEDLAEKLVRSAATARA